MTRFTFVCDDENCRFKDNGETIDCVEVVDLLNKLYEENEQLRKQVAEYEMILRQHEFAEKEGFK